ncbi:tail fiber protein [Burkholderia phage DC1]|uniref:Tail fiber protein n=1 Tax=Burkholderia phage DC1 TaxID=2881398 RepID=I6NVP1_9CAUD|nr:tail fiber protein [Burkholderia phage DC1]AEZ50875.1 tail fiber protein [Burkholderia phage DC1]
MALKLANNAVSKLAGAVAANATSIAVTPGDGAKYPTLSAGDWFPLTVVKSDGSLEVMRCTARTTDTLTVSRAQEGTAALAFAAGDRVELRFTAAAAMSFASLTGAQFTGDVSVYSQANDTVGAISASSYSGGLSIEAFNSGNTAKKNIVIAGWGGRVLVGNGVTDDGASKLQVNGDITNAKGSFYCAKDGATVRRLIGLEAGSSHVDIQNSAGQRIRFINQAYNAELGWIDNGGNFWTAGNMSAFSDRRVKSNIKRIKGAMAKVRELVGVTFTRRRSKDKSRHMGFIAQDVEPIVPEVVRTDEKGMKSIAYPNLTALLAEALKELDDRVAALESNQ